MRSSVRELDAVLDASFVKAWSIRYPDDSRAGFSDVEARVGRNGRGYDLGYKLHVAVDHKRILPLAEVMTPANENEKRHAPSLVERTRMRARMTLNKVRGLLNASVYALLSVLCCVLKREAAENMGRPDRALSPTFFNV